MPPEQLRTLHAAIAACSKSTGLKLRCSTRRDPLVEVVAKGNKHRFAPAVKTVDRFVTPATVVFSGNQGQPAQLLVARYITRETGEHCRELRLPFIDTAGNCYLEAPGLFVYVTGHARIAHSREPQFRAMKAAGLKVTFALLCRPQLLEQSYRSIAVAANVSLGTVSADMKDLDARKCFGTGNAADRKLLQPEKMLEEWAIHYPATLRPKLRIGRFSADPDRLTQLELEDVGAYWGGEVAADKMTRYLKPAHFTIYAAGSISTLVLRGRMRADEKGNVEILEKFWDFEPQIHEMPDVVPAVLAYADLVATGDARNAEAARLIYERRIVPAFDTAK